MAQIPTSSTCCMMRFGTLARKEACRCQYDNDIDPSLKLFRHPPITIVRIEFDDSGSQPGQLPVYENKIVPVRDNPTANYAN